MNSIIVTESLCREFDNGITAVRDFNISIERGETISLLGPNGAGKTTTMRMLAGLIAPSSGRVIFDGKIVSENIYDVHAKIGILTESFGLYEKMSAWENLMFFGSFYDNIDPARQTEKYLKIVDLYERRNDRVSSFSKGMKQRIAIARSLINDPEIVFLDEPTSGLDPASAAGLRDFLRELKKRQTTIFICTHNLEEADMLSDRIGIFNQTLLVLDSPQALRNNYFQRTVTIITDSDNTEAIKAAHGIQSVRKTENGYILTIHGTTAVSDIVKMLADKGIVFDSIYENKPAMEDIYFKFINRNKDEFQA